MARSLPKKHLQVVVEILANRVLRNHILRQLHYWRSHHLSQNCQIQRHRTQCSHSKVVMVALLVHLRFSDTIPFQMKCQKICLMIK